MQRKPDRSRLLAGVWCFGIMIVLGVSDALRGVFLPVLREHFAMSQTQGAWLIMLSYISNLLFLAIGGTVIDRLGRRQFFGAVILIWMTALLLYALTDSVLTLFCGMLLSLGASTMLSTTVNLTTPLLFLSPAMMVNLFNFGQGIGISAAQNLGGRFSYRFSAWQRANLLLLCAGVILLVLLLPQRMPQKQAPTENKPPLKAIFRAPAAKYLLLMIGFYAVAEHGLQNWLVTYGSESLGFTREQSAKFLSYFFLGITAGRLVFAPLVQKIGMRKSLTVFISTGAALYIAGMLLRGNGIALICLSGLAFSVIWPTMILMIGTFYPEAQRGAATSWISGLANLFDIAFNAGFGPLTALLGLKTAILVLPVCMLGCPVALLLLLRLPAHAEQ